MSGRFAPSPTGDLHLGNLRTAVAAWLLARAAGLDYLVRMEDLDRVTSSAEHERAQLADLARLGMRPDGKVVRQSDRFDLYRDALSDLRARGLVYPCWCTRREIAAEVEAAASAPHEPVGHEAPPLAYPGTCARLTSSQRAERESSGRPPALRLRAEGVVVEVVDRLHGRRTGLVDDVVLQRGDGVPAYNLAVVVDDHLQGVTQVVRGDDLLTSTPRQVRLQRLLGLPTPEYVHVPLVVGADGQRLAKRHGAVTLGDLERVGLGPSTVLERLLRSLGVDEFVAAGPDEMLESPTGLSVADLLGRIPPTPVVVDDLVDLPRSRP